MVVHQKREAKVSFPSIRWEDRSLCVHGLWIGFSEGLLVELASGKKAERYAGDTTSKSKNGKIEREDGLMLLQAITRSLPEDPRRKPLVSFYNHRKIASNFFFLNINSCPYSVLKHIASPFFFCSLFLLNSISILFLYTITLLYNIRYLLDLWRNNFVLDIDITIICTVKELYFNNLNIKH